MENGDRNQGPLAIYSVLDLAVDKGVYGIKILGELGTDVIEIEPPQGAPEGRALKPSCTTARPSGRAGSQEA